MLWQKEDETRPPLVLGHPDPARPRLHAQVRRQHRAGRRFRRTGAGAAGADAELEGVVTVDPNGKLIETNAYRNDITGGWRMAVRLRRNDDTKPVELRGYLRQGNDTLSETWSYILPPN